MKTRIIRFLFCILFFSTGLLTAEPHEFAFKKLEDSSHRNFVDSDGMRTFRAFTENKSFVYVTDIGQSVLFARGEVKTSNSGYDPTSGSNLIKRTIFVEDADGEAIGAIKENGAAIFDYNSGFEGTARLTEKGWVIHDAKTGELVAEILPFWSDEVPGYAFYVTLHDPDALDVRLVKIFGFDEVEKLYLIFY